MAAIANFGPSGTVVDKVWFCAVFDPGGWPLCGAKLRMHR